MNTKQHKLPLPGVNMLGHLNDTQNAPKRPKRRRLWELPTTKPKLHNISVKFI